ncbi:tRNA (guanosine(37)-N1)-methyltransferase TrmD [Lacihabitans sp. CCS-44]|jgi:tRNA (guanine37-N1)-methyltransferase|uniref:tRNA (guanosine(37)-N1)-methyltransferase TrmD n=1 Tax=Lacihabitans sp. CCS-44 TaxID=2487331 RepID=UPI0020CDA70A|nr:tRNA (guanosine(37)-N1)-methyltransferase TrmD [Lacihabitans sp. CCS-44]MCP9756979.1 tRNA (guanosine(37)-N1)-methyltransferase TrmD [Lacihabitans sp. CCS-44]
MKIDIISCQPGLIDGFFSQSIVKNAIQNNFVEINTHDLRPFGNGNYRQIDDYQYGGGAGMVLMIEPLAKLIRQLQEKTTYDQVIYLTPDGKTLNQKSVNKLSLSKNLLMICGHYKGIDERVRELFVTQEISIGDYVLSGGEIAAAVLTDAIVRLIPGVINDETSALTDSFQDDLLAPPVYTRPADFEGTKVPEILMSGNEKLINDWRLEKSIERTTQRRPDLLTK